MNVKLTVFLLLVCSVCMLDCSKKAMVRTYYVLEPDTLISSGDIQISETLPYSVDVREFNIAKAFGQPRIAVRLESHAINYYYYHLWATHPSSTITYMVFRLIDGSGMFKKTTLGFSIESDYIVTGNIHKLEIIERDDDLFAHLNIIYSLIDNQNDEEIVRTSSDRVVKLEEKSINEFAAEISQLIKETVHDYLMKVNDQLSSK